MPRQPLLDRAFPRKRKTLARRVLVSGERGANFPRSRASSVQNPEVRESSAKGNTFPGMSTLKSEVSAIELPEESQDAPQPWKSAAEVPS